MNVRTQKRTAMNHEPAFTLIELVLVMALLVAAVSVSAPMLSSFFRGRALDSEARRLLALTHAGQSRAVSEGTPMLLWVDAPQRAYGLERESAARNGDPKAENFTLAEYVQLDAVSAQPVSVDSRKLPAIRFLPDGSIDESSPSALHLAGADGSTLWLVEAANHLSYAIQNSSK
jgi:type II secretion system protein H